MGTWLKRVLPHLTAEPPRASIDCSEGGGAGSQGKPSQPPGLQDDQQQNAQGQGAPCTSDASFASATPAHPVERMPSGGGLGGGEGEEVPQRGSAGMMGLRALLKSQSTGSALSRRPLRESVTGPAPVVRPGEE